MKVKVVNPDEFCGFVTVGLYDETLFLHYDGDKLRFPTFRKVVM